MEGGRVGGRGRRERRGRREGGGGGREGEERGINHAPLLMPCLPCLILVPGLISAVEDEYMIFHVELKEMGEMVGYVGLKKWVT